MRIQVVTNLGLFMNHDFFVLISIGQNASLKTKLAIIYVRKLIY